MRELLNAEVLLGLAALVVAGCSSSVEPDPVPMPSDTLQVVPLDGRGGGIITYSLQPTEGSDPINAIHAINVDGTGDVRLIGAQTSLSHPSWSPDGQQLAVTRYYDETNSAIFIFDASGGNPTRLTSTGGVLDGYPSWSPDGSQIAFHRFYPSENREEIWLMNSDGSNQHWIGIEGGSAKWSPDGTRLIYHAMRGDSYDLYVCTSDGTNEERLTSTSSGALSPVWSPNGVRVAFTAVQPDLTHHVFVMDSDGANLRQVAEGGAPRWSPDGSQLAFHSDGVILVIGADGTGQRQVTHPPSGFRSLFPVWRPGFP